MNLLLKNAYIITGDENGSVIKDGCVGIKGKILSYVGVGYEGIGERYDRVLDLTNKVIMPGFVNTHNHSAMSIFRNYADDLKLMEWLFNKIFPLEERLTEKDVYWASSLAILEMLKTGTTAFCDMYMFMNQTAFAVSESGIKASLGRGLQGDIDDSVEEDFRIKESLNLYNAYHGSCGGRIRANLAPHSVYTCNLAYLERVAGIAEDLGCEVQIHLSETDEEVRQSILKYNLTPIKVAYKAGLLNSNTIAAHCVVVNDEDLDIVVQQGVNIAHNPTSNMKLGSGIAPVKKMLDMGINVALGTDGASSNNDLDMLKEARTAAYLQKAILKDPSVLNADEVIQMATYNGAKALGFENTGKILKGYAADLIIIDIEKPWYYPKHNIKSSIIYSGSSKDVETVIVDGDIIMENGEVKTMDEEKILYEVQKAADKLVKSGKRKA